MEDSIRPRRSFSRVGRALRRSTRRRCGNVGRNVLFLDYVSGDAFEELLTNAMLLVLPSEMEGLSVALLEAMGAGVCVLTSDIPENREVVEGVGFLFRAGDVDDLEAMLRFLIADPAARRSAARQGKQRIQDNYQWNEITKQVEQVYVEVMGQQEPIPAAVSPNQDPMLGRKPANSLSARSNSRRRTG